MTIEQLYQLFLQYPEVTTDSRNINKPCLFFALRGEHFNGNEYAISALGKGAAYAIVDESRDWQDDRIIVVRDTLTCLQQLATYHRNQLGLPIVAITGSNGKTTTKELVASVLKQQYKISFTRGNLNNHIGVPLTLLSFSHETEIGVVEMGANHPGEIDILCRIAQPDYGLITNVGKAHLEGFGGFDGVIKTKSELYRYLESTGGSVFINAGNHLLVKAAGNILNLITYGTGEECWVRGEEINSGNYLNLRTWFTEGVLYFNTRLSGSYNLENVLAAIAIGRHFNIDPLLIKQGIESYEPSNNRSQLMTAGSNKIIMDAYNANPTSMQASIDNFLSVNFPQKLAILGDMLELGSYSREEHQKIVDQLSEIPLLSVILVGREFCATLRPEGFKCFENTVQAQDYLTENRPSDTLILIKGSRGIGLEKLTGSLY
ncbi:MAG: UDP-N-acetylmuramoyl-tripeptide--D-alanyl-D-alanine ligase [Bacteroidota bacterium]